MDKELWNKIKNAAEDSIKNPGMTKGQTPKNELKSAPEIYVFRHGETYDNKKRIFSGWRDSKLTPLGKKQAEELAEKLKNKQIDLCITSPQSRSIETARIAFKYKNNIVFEKDRRIMERNYGKLQGQSKELWMKKDPEKAILYRRSYDYAPPGGESMKMVEGRVFPFCEEVVERVKKDKLNIAISAHGNSMRAIRRYFEGLSVVEELTIENPLGRDYCQYAITPTWSPPNRDRPH